MIISKPIFRVSSIIFLYITIYFSRRYFRFLVGFLAKRMMREASLPPHGMAVALASQKWKFATAYLFFLPAIPLPPAFHLAWAWPSPSPSPVLPPRGLCKRSMNRERNSSGKLSRNVSLRLAIFSSWHRPASIPGTVQRAM